MWHYMDPIRLVKQVLQLLYGNCSRRSAMKINTLKIINYKQMMTLSPKIDLIGQPPFSPGLSLQLSGTTELGQKLPGFSVLPPL